MEIWLGDDNSAETIYKCRINCLFPTTVVIIYFVFGLHVHLLINMTARRLHFQTAHSHG
jgi:hypothetical protein